GLPAPERPPRVHSVGHPVPACRQARPIGVAPPSARALSDDGRGASPTERGGHGALGPADRPLPAARHGPNPCTPGPGRADLGGRRGPTSPEPIRPPSLLRGHRRHAPLEDLPRAVPLLFARLGPGGPRRRLWDGERQIAGDTP